jgi:tRNA(Met) cytidine acetyltransferase
MTLRELLAEVAGATKTALENRHRFAVFICSDELDDRVLKMVKKVYKTYLKVRENEENKKEKKDKNKDKKRLLVVGRSRFLEMSEKYFEGTFLHYRDSPSVLGETYSSLILDLSDGFHPNDLGIIVETIAEGGIIIALSPPLEKWSHLISKWHEELVSEPYLPSDIVPRFFRRFIQKTLESEGIIIFDANVRRRKLVKKYTSTPSEVSREEIVIPEEREMKRKLYKLCATQDQVKVLQIIEKLFERERERKAIVITADRGRGKTAVLGIATPHLISKMNRLLKRPVRVLVVAPSPQAVQTYFRFLLKSMIRQGMGKGFVKESNGMITVVNNRYARVEYVVPRRAMIEKDFADIVIVDEAAGIDVPVLWRITEGVRYIIFSSTIHGYEGAGRGFSIRFLKRLEEDETIEVEKAHMEEPVRYGKGDPIERWLYDVLLLDAQPAQISEDDVEAIRQGRIEFLMLDKDRLIENDELLRQFFGIYVLAHYRNRPSDLAILLDMPNHLAFAARVNGKIVCSLHIAVEGRLDEETIRKISEGYKPKGQIIPDLILKHYWKFDFPETIGLRIVRIATHPSLMKMGIGTFALLKTVEWASLQGMDWVGSGFGVSPELLRFWTRSGFLPIHITPQRNEISGEHTVIVIKALKPPVDGVVEELNTEFTRRLIEYLGDELRDLETETAILLLNSLVREIHTIKPEFGEVERRRMSKYLHGMSLYEYVSDVVRPVVRYYYSTTSKVDLSDEEEYILVAKCLQLKPWREIGVAEGYVKYRILMKAVQKVWGWYRGEN